MNVALPGINSASVTVNANLMHFARYTVLNGTIIACGLYFDHWRSFEPHDEVVRDSTERVAVVLDAVKKLRRRDCVAARRTGGRTQ
jgi:hypothetical protein